MHRYGVYPKSDFLQMALLRVFRLLEAFPRLTPINFAPAGRSSLDIVVRVCSNTDCAAADCGGTPSKNYRVILHQGPALTAGNGKGGAPTIERPS
jgi:hypothetical protein